MARIFVFERIDGVIERRVCVWVQAREGQSSG